MLHLNFGIPLAARLWHLSTKRPQNGAVGQADNMKRTRPAIGPLFYFGTAAVLGLYFTFAAVQGAYGVFNRVQIEAEINLLRAERDRINQDLAEVENRTRRLSDDFLDLDLLDERARDVLGLARPDEIIIR